MVVHGLQLRRGIITPEDHFGDFESGHDCSFSQLPVIGDVIQEVAVLDKLQVGSCACEDRDVRRAAIDHVCDRVFSCVQLNLTKYMD